MLTVIDLEMIMNNIDNNGNVALEMYHAILETTLLKGKITFS